MRTPTADPHAPPEPANDAQDRALTQALKALHAEVLSEPVPPALLAAAQAASAVHARSSRWWRWGGLAASLLLTFGMGWLARGLLPLGDGPQADNSLAAVEGRFAQQAQLAHVVYAPEVKHPVEVAAEQQAHLVQWLSKRLGRPLKVPQLHAEGFDLVGGRLLPGEDGARAQFMFQNPAGERLTLYIGAVTSAHGKAQATAKSGETAFSYSADGAVPAFYWVDQGFGYALSGKLERAQLLSVAQAVYRQL